MSDRSATIDVPSTVMRDVVELRRDFHAHPELGFEEVRSAGIVAERLRRLGYEVRSGIAETGVLGILRTRKKGRTILLRADMDALPVEERSAVDFASLVHGKMHACGHDAHMAILLGAAQLIMEQRDALCGTIVLCFQPAEEGLGGAKAMVEAGVLEDPHVDAVFGLHIWSRLPSGVIATAPGPIMASSDAIEVTVKGKGGHGAAPHESVDPIVTAAQFISSLQHVVSRTIDPVEPAVITIGAVHGGTTYNVIPDDVRMLGTVRTFDPALREAMPGKIERTLNGCCAAANASYDFVYLQRYPVTANDAEQAEYVRRLALRTVGETSYVPLKPIMGSEDFSFMLQQRPGCFFFLGACGSERNAYPHHSSQFTIDEAALANGVRMMVALALDAPNAVRTLDT